MKRISAIVLVLGLNCDFEAYQGGESPQGPKGKSPVGCKCCASQGGCNVDDGTSPQPFPLPVPNPPAPPPSETPPCNPPKPCKFPK